MTDNIPFNKPAITGKEIEYISDAIASGRIGAGGPYTNRCASLLEDLFAINKVLLTPSATAALEMAAMLCALEPGDEVIMPSFTFVSTANAVARMGARPVFVEIRSDTLNIDETLIEKAITDRTKAIFPVHYAAVSCDMDTIKEIASRRGLMVVEDAAQAVNAFYKDRALGSLGHLGAYSFHDTKNYVCGEGGALCVNSPELMERAEIIREKGTNRGKFLRGEVDKYTWVDIGSSFIPSEIACAFLLAQLETVHSLTEKRRGVFDFYCESLKPLEEARLLRLPVIPAHCSTNYHMFYILLPDGPTRNELMAHLKRCGISSVFHYVPLHTSPMGARYGCTAGDLPLTENLSERLLRLPCFAGIGEGDMTRVVSEVSSFLEARALTNRPAGPAGFSG